MFLETAHFSPPLLPVMGLGALGWHASIIRGDADSGLGLLLLALSSSVLPTLFISRVVSLLDSELHREKGYILFSL